MKSRKIWGALLALGMLEGCGKEDAGGCVQDADCTGEQFCHTDTRQCTGPRYTALNLPTLSENTVVGGGVLRVQAVLALQSGARPVYPSQLELTVTPVNGGASTVVPLTATTPEGTYTGEWTPPAGEATYTFRVASSEPGIPERSVKVTVDRTAPALTLSVPSASHEAKEGFSYTDPVAATAWARDQTVTVRLESDATDIAPIDSKSARVVVRGHSGGTNVTDLAVKPVPCARAWCGAVDVPLWRPGLEAFRGTFQVDVAVKDGAGNEGMASASIPVTRWKWAFDGGSGPILTTPALGEKGTVYFGTSGAQGKVFALNPEGTRKWEAALGAVNGSPSVGQAPDGTDRVYVGATTPTAGGVLFMLDGMGKTAARCPEEGKNYGFAPIISATALLNAKFYADRPAAETAVAISSNRALLTLKPEDGVCGTLGAFYTAPGSSVIVHGSDLFFGAFSPDAPPYEDINVLDSLSYEYGADSGNPKFDEPTLRAPVTGMALARTATGNYVLAAEGATSPDIGGIEAYDVARGGRTSWRYPSSFSGVAPVRNLILGAGNTLFFGHETSTGSSFLTAIDLFATAPRVSVPNAGSFPGAPVLGASNILYTASAKGPAAGLGEVAAWSSDKLSLRWKLDDSVGSAQVSPALDCSRQTDGTAAREAKGVLYVPALDGRLYALVVDSPGLDKNAPWPKYQRDARNTGTFDAPLTNCP